jgi:hypothetical protein
LFSLRISLLNLVAMQLLNFDDIFGPLDVMSKILAIHPYRWRNGQLKYSVAGIIQTVVFLTVYLVVGVVYCQNYISSIPTDFIKIKTIQFMMVTQRVGYLCVMTLAFVNVFLNYRKFVDARNSIREVDSELVDLGQGDVLVKSGHEIRRVMIVSMVVMYVSLTLLPAIFSNIDKSHNHAIAFVFMVYPRMVTVNANLSFYSFVMLVHHRLTILNQIVIAEKRILRSPLDLDFCDRLNRYVRLHKLLTNKCRTVNSIFSLHLLLWITINFIGVVGDLYFSVCLIPSGLLLKYFKTYSVLVYCIIIYCGDLWYIAKKASGVCFEVNHHYPLLFLLTL